MTSEIMLQWLRKVDKDMRKQSRKILLFFDNAPSHTHLPLTNVRLCLFPPNKTSVVQPMNQGIIQSVNLKNRSKHLKQTLSNLDNSDKVGSQLLKEISILDAINWLCAAWKELNSAP